MTFEDEETVRNIIREELQSTDYDNSISHLRDRIDSLESTVSNLPQKYELDSEIRGVQRDIDDLKTSIRHRMPIF